MDTVSFSIKGINKSASIVVEVNQDYCRMLCNGKISSKTVYIGRVFFFIDFSITM